MKPTVLCLKPTIFVSLQKVMHVDNREGLFVGELEKKKVFTGIAEVPSWRWSYKHKTSVFVANN